MSTNTSDDMRRGVQSPGPNADERRANRRQKLERDLESGERQRAIEQRVEEGLSDTMPLCQDAMDVYSTRVDAIAKLVPHEVLEELQGPVPSQVCKAG